MKVATGTGVVNGIAIGKLKLFKPPVYEISEEKTGVPDSEVSRFEAAIAKVKEQQHALYEKAVKEIVTKVDSIIPENLPAERPITWFELVTLFSFLCFRTAKTKWNVFEVGMGGRLDATNIIRPKLCCITPIELEHTEFLGDSLEKIASEKAGIIKNCTPVLFARQPSDSVNIVLREKAFTRHAPHYFIDELVTSSSYSFDEKNYRMKVHFESSMFNRPVEAKLRLLGKMQSQNAAMACIAAKKLLPNIDESIIERGLEKAKLHGRFEIKENPQGLEGLTIILDGAHTVNSVSLTIDTLNKLFESKKTNLLFACARDKDVKDIAKLFTSRFSQIFATIPGNKKESNLQMLKEAFKRAKLDFTSSPDYKYIIREAIEKSIKEKAILLVTGSFYLLAETEAVLKKYCKA